MKLTRLANERNTIANAIARNSSKTSLAFIKSINGQTANIYLSDNSQLIHNVEIHGDPSLLKRGDPVSIFWQENRPYIIAPKPNENVIPPHVHSEASNDGGLLQSYFGKNLSMPDYGNSEYFFFGGAFTSNIDGGFETTTNYLGFVWVWDPGNEPGTYIYVQPYLREGYYEIDWFANEGTGLGIYDFYLDNVIFATKDFYRSTTTYNVLNNFQFSVPYTGVHTLKIQVDAKNPSSSNYRITNAFMNIRKV